MRTAGDVATPEGLGAHDHLCWVFDDAADFRRRASRFLAEGIEQGLAGVWVGTRSHDELADELGDLDVAALERTGALTILALPSDRPDDGPGPAEQAAFWEDWTRQSTGAGFRGLRAAGDTTEWVRRPEEQAVHLAYEAALDGVTRRVPFSALCAFDRSRLGADVAAAFAELHPLVNDGATRFQLFFGERHDLDLRGEVDLTDVQALRRTLEIVVTGAVTGSAITGHPVGDLHVDAARLRFIDHHGLLVLDEFGEERGTTLVLHDAQATCAHEVADLLHLQHVRVADEGRDRGPVDPLHLGGRGRGGPGL